MFTSLTLWFRRAFRPHVCSVGIQLLVNGKVQDLTTYPDQKLRGLLDAVDSLWKPNKQSTYWFETEIHKRGFPFTKKKIEMQVTCYTEKQDSMEKTRYDMPIAVRKRMFNKLFQIEPVLNGKVWSGVVEVKFTNVNR